MIYFANNKIKMKDKFLKIKKIIKGLQNKLEKNIVEKNHDENILKQDLIWAKV